MTSRNPTHFSALNHHLRKRPRTGDTWHFCINVPSDLRDRVKKPWYISFSLDTADDKTARERRDRLLEQYQRQYDKLRARGANHHMRLSGGNTGNWCFGIVVPEELRSRVGKTFIHVNLGTKDVEDARKQRDVLHFEHLDWFARLRNSKVEPTFTVKPATVTPATVTPASIAPESRTPELRPFANDFDSMLSVFEAVSGHVKSGALSLDDVKSIYHLIGIEPLREQTNHERMVVMDALNAMATARMNLI